MNRLPIRLRLTFAFAIAMALVLAGMGFFVYLRVGQALLGTVDQTLRAQALEAVSHARGGADLADRDVAGGTTLSQLLTGDGRVAMARFELVVRAAEDAVLAPLTTAERITLSRLIDKVLVAQES